MVINMRKIIGRNISILYRNEHHFVDIKLKKYHLNKVQAEVLLYLKDDDGANQTKINAFFLFNKATITKIITHLEKNDYVNRIISESDRREKDIYLTDKGREILNYIRIVLKEWEDIIIDSIPDADIEKIKCLLSDMVDNVMNLKDNKE